MLQGGIRIVVGAGGVELQFSFCVWRGEVFSRPTPAGFIFFQYHSRFLNYMYKTNGLKRLCPSDCDVLML